MKNLFIIRHAKSSWAKAFSTDFDRRLNERGKTDALFMGERLKFHSPEIKIFLSSPATRAKKTAERFAKAFNPSPTIDFNEKLYMASTETFVDVISSLPYTDDDLAIFSHNFGITTFVNSLTPTKVDVMPTAAIFAVTVDCIDWKNFASAKKEFLFFEYPKMFIV